MPQTQVKWRLVWPALLIAVVLAAGYCLLAQQTEQPKATNDAKAKVDLYGDALPAGTLSRLGSVRFRHPSMITSIAVAPSGKEVVTLCQGSPMLRGCDLETGKISELFDLGAGAAVVPSGRRALLAFADSGKRILVVAGNYVGAIGIEKKTSLWKTDFQGFAYSAISPDGKWIALVEAIGAGRLLIVNAESGKIAHDIPSAGNSPTVVFTHDSKAVTVSTHNQSAGLRSWSVETGKELPALKEIQTNAMGLAYSPNGKWLAIRLTQPSILLFDLTTKKLKHTFSSFTTSLRWIDFTPGDEALLAYDGSSGDVTVLDPEQGKELRKFNIGPSQAAPVISPDGKSVIASSGNVVDVWKIESGEPVQSFDGHRAIVLFAAVSPNGKLAATTGQDNTLRVWDLATGRQLHMRRRPTYAAPTVCFTPSGERLLWASGPTTIEVLDVQSLIQNMPVAAPIPTIRGNQFATFAVSDDGKTVVANNSAGGGVQIWDLSKKDPAVTQVQPTFGAQSVPFAFSSDARLSATMFSVDGSGRQVVIADVARAREVMRLVSNQGQSTQQGVFAGSRLFASRAMRQIALWDVLSGKAVVTIDVSNAAAMTTAISCSPDGRLLVWAESAPQAADRVIRLYDALNGRELTTFTGHLGSVQTLRLHTYGDRPVLLSGSQDSTTLVWDLRGVMDELRRTTPRLSERQSDQVWADLGAEDAGAMHRASWVLAAAGDEAVPLLAERLKPAAIDPELGAKIDKLVAQMDDDLFSVREQASQQAADFGEAAEPYLKEALKATASAEARHRIRRLLTDIAGKPLVLSAEQQRAVRAVQVLEQIGGSKAREVLDSLTRGQPAARLTQEAKEALARLEERQKP